MEALQTWPPHKASSSAYSPLARRLWEAVNTLETIRSEVNPFTRRFRNAVIYIEFGNLRKHIGPLSEDDVPLLPVSLLPVSFYGAMKLTSEAAISAAVEFLEL